MARRVAEMPREAVASCQPCGELFSLRIAGINPNCRGAEQVLDGGGMLPARRETAATPARGAVSTVPDYTERPRATQPWLQPGRPVQPAWAATLSPLLDGQRSRLASGATISLPRTTPGITRLISGCRHLAGADLARTSRCSSTLFSSGDLGRQHLGHTWVKRNCSEPLRREDREAVDGKWGRLLTPVLGWGRPLRRQIVTRPSRRAALFFRVQCW